MPAIVQDQGILNAARSAIEVLLKFKGQGVILVRKGAPIRKPGGGHDFGDDFSIASQQFAWSQVGDDEILDGQDGDTPVVKRNYVLTGRYNADITVDDRWSDIESDYRVESVNSNSAFKTSCAVVGFVRPIDVPLPVPPGPGDFTSIDSEDVVHRTTAAALSGHMLVAPLDDGTVDYADCATLQHINRPIWLTTRSWSSGVVATLLFEGTIVEPSWTWTPGTPIFLGLNGVMTQTVPDGAMFSRQVATVIDATTIEFSVQPPIMLA